jgi:hypothetical protein
MIGVDMEDLIEYFRYLDELRDSGRTNMLLAGRFLEEEMGLPAGLADAVHIAWMETFSSDLTAAERAEKAIGA